MAGKELLDQLAASDSNQGGAPECAKHLPSALYTLTSLEIGFFYSELHHKLYMDMGLGKTLKPFAFSSTKQGNKPCLSLPQDYWRVVPMSLYTGDHCIKCPAHGLLYLRTIVLLHKSGPEA